MSTSQAGRDRNSVQRPKSRGSVLLRWVSVVIPIGVLTFLLIGFWPLIPVSLSGTVVACNFSCPAELTSHQQFSSGIRVTIDWVDVSGGGVNFYVMSPNGIVVCHQAGGSGSCSLNSTGGSYTFRADLTNFSSESTQLVNYTAKYHTSLLGQN
jgi:hypothetical protein